MEESRVGTRSATAPTKVLTWLRASFGTNAWRGTLAITDQAFVSATSFAASVIIGRVGGPHELGIYSLGFTIVVFVVALQDSLIALPYTVFCKRFSQKAQSGYAGDILAHFVLLAIAAAAILSCAAWVMSFGHGPSDLKAVIRVLAITVPLVLLREFGRRFLFAHLRMSSAILLDVGVALGMASGLLGLSLFARISAVSAHAILGMACGAAAVVWYLTNRKEFDVSWARSIPTLKHNWSFAKWVVGAQMASVVHGYIIPWLLALKLDASATGRFTACMTVVQLTNPFILGAGNFMAPVTAAAFAQGGIGELRRIVRKMAVLLGGGMTVFVFIVIVFGGEAMHLVFGARYAGEEATIVLLALAFLISVLSLPAEHALRAMGLPNFNFTANLIGLAVMLAGSLLLINRWGIAGAATGYLMGSVSVAIVRIRVFAARAEALQEERKAYA